MKKKEVYNLKPGQQINHKKYGACTIEKIMLDFGPVIQPNTAEGKIALHNDSGAEYGTPLLEDNFKEILCVVG